MAVVLLVLGLICLLFGLIRFAEILIKLAMAFYYYFFASEKVLDKRLQKQWSKEADYKAFEKQIPKEL